MGAPGTGAPMRKVAGPILLACALHAVPAEASRGSRAYDGVSSRLGVVATESPAASRVGRAVLEGGGNAIDAAAATVFALGVARPQSCGIGGGGFLVYRSHTGRIRTLDFRETAPAAIRADQFVDDPLTKQFTGHTTVGVPGTVAGMDAALARYGTLSLAEAVAPAEALARLGFRVPTSLTGAMRANAARLKLFPAAARQYLTPAGEAYAPGDTLVQPQLAATLRRIMRGGRTAFYRGTIARQIVAEMDARRATADPGLMTTADLGRYRAIWRTPVVSQYRGHEVATMGPPTSGGVAIVEMLNLLKRFDLKALGQSSAQTIHLVAEAQRIAWADRNAYLADPDQVPQPTAVLTSQAYADRRGQEIDPNRTRAHGPGDVSGASVRIDGGEENPVGSTTQVSIVDRRGNAVSLTCTIEQEFGSAVVVDGAGFLLNNELTDFGAPGSANQAAPFKRPRSSMSPVIVSRDGDRRPSIVTGGAGGATIVMGVLESILNRVDFGLSLADSVDAERFDDQGSSTLSIEGARLAAGVKDELTARGWTLNDQGEYGPRPRVQLAGTEPDSRRVAVSDSRSDHAALAQRR